MKFLSAVEPSGIDGPLCLGLRDLASFQPLEEAGAAWNTHPGQDCSKALGPQVDIVEWDPSEPPMRQREKEQAGC